MKNIIPSLIIICSFLIISCKNDSSNTSSPATLAFLEKQFAMPDIQKQTFTISTSDTTIIEGAKGTVILFQKDCFKNANGEVVNENVKIELVEALSMEDMLLSGLNTKDENGKILQTGGMLYFQASHDDEKLSIVTGKEPYVEIPTNNKVSGMQVYKGVVSDKGDFYWQAPRKLETFLIPVDFDQLNFRPKNFDKAVISYLKLKNLGEFSNQISDSIYYTLQPNCVYKKIEFKWLKTVDIDSVFINNETTCGITPTKIKTIRHRNFEQTFIATREFEQRMPFIQESCSDDILEIYIKNIDKNLWIADSLAYIKLLSIHPKLAPQFKNFYLQKLANVKDAPKNTIALQKFYKRKSDNFNQQLQKIEKKYHERKERTAKEYEQLNADYQKLQKKNEDYRKEKYGFKMTENGWVNIDKGTVEKDWGYFNIQLKISDGNNYDQVHGYLVFPNIRGIATLQNDNKKLLISGEKIEIPKYSPTRIIVVAYKGKDVFIDTLSLIASKQTEVNAELKKSTKSQITRLIKQYDTDKNPENNILYNLKIQNKRDQLKKKIMDQKQEEMDKVALSLAAFEGNQMTIGGNLFLIHCYKCHEGHMILESITEGPDLYQINKKRHMNWLIQFTKNPAKMIHSGDLEALKLKEAYKSVGVMPDFEHLSDDEIKRIFEFLEKLNLNWE